MTGANEEKSVSTSSQKDDIEEGVVINSSNTSSTYTSDSGNAKKRSRKGLWFFTLLNFLGIVAICAGAYWYYMQQQQALSQRVDDLAPIKSNLANAGRSIDELNASINDKTQANAQSIDSLLAQVLENNEANKALQKQLSEVSGRRPSDWLLAEASYLVNMAGRKLYLENDIRTSITLLQEADARLEDLNDPSMLPIRALVANDIQNLKQVNPVSTTSIALAISGMLGQVSELPLENLKLPEPAQDELGTELSNDTADWQENLKRTWRAIVGDFISIKRVEKPLSPYLSERQQWLVEQELKHALTQAQSAALREEYTLYQTALQQAVALIIEHYKIDENDVTQFMNGLQQLQGTNFERNYPKELVSVDALKDAIERRMERQFNNRDAVL
jgi:uroporphyrin-3 C-methyltransferase